MPKQKQQWLPAQDVDPDFFKIPSQTSKAIVIRSPNGTVAIDRKHSVTSDDLAHGKGGSSEPCPVLPVPTKSTGADKNDTLSSYTADSTKRDARIEAGVGTARALQAYRGRTESAANGVSQPPANWSSTIATLSQSSQQLQTSRTQPLRSNLDIYAHKYVPFWLRAVNESAAVPIIAPQLQHVDCDNYRLRFVGHEFLANPPHVDLPIQHPSPLQLEELQSSTYQQYWQERLQNEFAAQALQNDQFGLFNIDVFIHDPSINSYTVKVPGVREYTPRIDLGDILYIRPLAPVLPHTIAQLCEKWTQVRDRVAPGFTGHEHHAVVWSVLRRNETVIIRLGQELVRGAKCNVIIPLSAHKYVPVWQAVNVAQTSLNANGPKASWLTCMLFPSTSHGVLQTSLPKGSFDLQWYDAALNFEQKRAVQAVVDAQYGQAPYLISGPPGTGKTKTIVETVLQLLRTPSHVTPHLLVCAPSDAAADTLLTRLSAHLLPQDLFRLNNWTRLPSEVPGEVRPYCYLDETNLYTLPPFERLMAASVVVTSCRDANMLAAAGLTNQALTQTALRMLRAIAPAAADGKNLLHWTALLLDEAAQATEPEALIPLNVVAPLEVDLDHMSKPQVIMAGDEYQLGPRLTSAAIFDASATFDTSGLETSLFQRLFLRPLYKDHPLSRAHGLRPLTRDMLPILRPPFGNLIRNYRSHPAILSTSSALFYSDTLIPECPEVSPALLSWPLWPKQKSSVWPVMFYQNAGPDSVESVTEGDGTGSGSLTNHTEAQIALQMVVSLLQHVNGGPLVVPSPELGKGYLQPVDFIIMSPFRAQVNYLRKLFRDAGLYDVRIGPLEAFQGLESRVVVLCTTRTRFGQTPHLPAKYVNEDKARNLGVIDEPKRFNVAMTRAKEALIVIGHAEVLSCTRDICWLSFLKFCLRNDLCRGGQLGWVAKKDKSGRTKEGMGKLEMALRYADQMQETRHQTSDDAREQQINGDMVNEGHQNFKFRLRGTMIDLDEQMWQMQVAEGEEDMMREEEQDEEEENSLCDGDSNDGDEEGKNGL